MAMYLHRNRYNQAIVILRILTWMSFAITHMALYAARASISRIPRAD